MLAEIGLMTNGDAIDQAVEDLQSYYELEPEERAKVKKPRVPKPKYIYKPIAIRSEGISLAYIAEDNCINIKHDSYAEWMALKNDSKVWNECARVINGKTVRGFGEK